MYKLNKIYSIYFTLLIMLYIVVNNIVCFLYNANSIIHYHNTN